MSGNLFAPPERTAAPDVTAPTDEYVEALLCRPGLRIERIVSTGQASPPGFWYDQDTPEWVVLLSGTAELQFADETMPRVLRPGDWVHIPAHRRHRVSRSDPVQASVWLAIHYRDETTSPSADKTP